MYCSIRCYHVVETKDDINDKDKKTKINEMETMRLFTICINNIGYEKRDAMIVLCVRYTHILVRQFIRYSQR